MSSIGIVDDITDAYLVVYLALERKNLVPIVFYLVLFSFPLNQDKLSGAGESAGWRFLVGLMKKPMWCVRLLGFDIRSVHG